MPNTTTRPPATASTSGRSAAAADPLAGSALSDPLAGVQVHQDGGQGSGAGAYAQGSDLAFGAGSYAPGTKSGRRMLAHETAHQVQQRQGRVPE